MCYYEYVFLLCTALDFTLDSWDMGNPPLDVAKSSQFF